MIARVSALALVLLVALLLQTVVAPVLSVGGWRPDFLLLTVVGLALIEGPGSGARYGFAAGLAADLLSGGNHLVGINALVFLLVGDAVGRLRPYLSGTAHAGEVALGAIAGAAAFALFGSLSMLLDIRQFTWQVLVEGIVAATVWTAVGAPLAVRPMAAVARRFSAPDTGPATAGTPGRPW